MFISLVLFHFASTRKIEFPACSRKPTFCINSFSIFLFLSFLDEFSCLIFLIFIFQWMILTRAAIRCLRLSSHRRSQTAVQPLFSFEQFPVCLSARSAIIILDSVFTLILLLFLINLQSFALIPQPLLPDFLKFSLTLPGESVSSTLKIWNWTSAESSWRNFQIIQNFLQSEWDQGNKKKLKAKRNRKLKKRK